MITCGLGWLSLVLWLIKSNAIAREIRPVVEIANFLDKLPEVVNTPIFLLLWFIFLCGWLVLLVWAARGLMTKKDSAAK